ncbi:MAG: hypothetical protein EPN92_07375 [Chitinophagaceae bacterium]|nr:MAG: hypothetical protein EPN92_07375 [Chitinophagaceae bacterium]
MQRKYLIRIILVLLLVTGSFLILNSTIQTKNSPSSTCSESMEKCTNNKGGSSSPSGEMIWETISRQFISSVEIGR